MDIFPAKVSIEFFFNMRHHYNKKYHRPVASYQFYRLVATCKQFATNLSISLSCNKSVKVRLNVFFHLQICYNSLKQLAASLWITNFDNQLTTSLMTTWDRLVVNKLSQGMQTHPDIGLLITNLLQDGNRLIATWAFMQEMFA